MKHRVFISSSFDPWFNLATEDYIFRDMDSSSNILFLWRNKDVVVIGRNQNPWAECNLQKMEDDGVRLARRQSGGGAVFHDLGNTNFTFLSSKENYDKNANFEIIVKALAKFEIHAEQSGRNDIVVAGRKVSGSAFKESKESAFHHGTLLIDANLSRLAEYLNPDKKKLMMKGIQSVKSRVANLSEFSSLINHESLSNSIIEEFSAYHHQKIEIEVLDVDELKGINSLNSYYCKLSSWEWRFGKTPEFDYKIETRFDWGGIEVLIKTEHGLIRDATIFSDSLYPEMIEACSKVLIGQRYSPVEVNRSLASIADVYPDLSENIEEFIYWLVSQIK